MTCRVLIVMLALLSGCASPRMPEADALVYRVNPGDVVFLAPDDPRPKVIVSGWIKGTNWVTFEASWDMNHWTTVSTGRAYTNAGDSPWLFMRTRKRALTDAIPNHIR